MEEIIKAYAAINNNVKTRMSSSSGGVFSLIAENVLENNGIVYGVELSNDCRKAQYSRVNKLEDLDKLKGSKYLQASVCNAFKQAKRDLDEGRDVVFSGTGCVINALHLFLGKEYDNLLCVDIICHGVPSPLIWQKYVEHMENIQKSKIVKICFRCKDEGWRSFGIMQEYDGKRVFSPKKKDPYLQLFLSNCCLRPSCYKCEAKTIRMADITLGDFWGIEHFNPEMDDNLGTSFIICRTCKGNDCFERVKDKMTWDPVKYKDVIPYNIAEIQSVSRPTLRESFYSDVTKMTMQQIEKKYLSLTIKERIKEILKSIIAQITIRRTQ